ncbi:MAG TPA: hypothetical protein VFB66_31010 [Tepidisphaeraceae bacterium]|nr:hypothetical protein [Tepidisphaeraceae bacterium]
MHRAAICCFVTVTFATTAALSQRAPIRRTPPPVDRPAPRQPIPTRPVPAPTRQVPARSNPSRQEKPNAAGDSGPVRPAGFKPVTLATAQKETERLRAAIEKLEQRLSASGDASAAAEEAGATTADAKEGEKAAKDSGSADKEGGAAPKTAAEKRTVAGVEIENRSLRKQVDVLLVKVAEKEGTIPERPAGLPKYDPHVIDSPTNADFCPGKTLEQLEDTMRFAGFPVGESEEGGVCYEWIFHVTKAERKAHATLRIWAIMKDGVAAETKQAAPGVVKEGPPPKFTPTR